MLSFKSDDKVCSAELLTRNNCIDLPWVCFRPGLVAHIALDKGVSQELILRVVERTKEEQIIESLCDILDGIAQDAIFKVKRVKGPTKDFDVLLMKISMNDPYPLPITIESRKCLLYVIAYLLKNGIALLWKQLSVHFMKLIRLTTNVEAISDANVEIGWGSPFCPVLMKTRSEPPKFGEILW